jgi:hypothetical protein
MAKQEHGGTGTYLSFDNAFALPLPIIAILELQIKDADEDDIQEAASNASVHAVVVVWCILVSNPEC